MTDGGQQTGLMAMFVLCKIVFFMYDEKLQM